MPAWAEWLFRLSVRLHPRDFRERYRPEMLATFREAWNAEPGRLARGVHLLRSIGVALLTGIRQRSQRAGERRGSPDAWRLDLRHAVRALLRRPALALIIVATLAIGVGANAAVFAALHAIVLSPLPYPDADRLVRLHQLYQTDAEERARSLNSFGGFMTLPALMHFRENTRMLSHLGAVHTYSAEGADLTGGARPERLRVLRVGADYFAALGIGPASGRIFERTDERAGATVAVVSAALAERLYGNGAAAVDATALLDGVAHDVIGVMPVGLEDPLMGTVDVWLPLDLRPSGHEPWEWDNHYLSAIGRLAPGHMLAEARAEFEHLSLTLETEAKQVMQITSDDWRYGHGYLMPLQEAVVGARASLLQILMGAVILLLLITCVNVAVLLIARGLGRAHDVALRAALGSSRIRLARQFLFEGLLLAVAGGSAGLAVAVPLVRLLANVAPAGLLDRMPHTPSMPVIFFGLGAALIAGLVFGLAPALRLGKLDAASALREATRGSDGSRAARARSVLVVAQVALAMVLLIGAGVLLQSLVRLQRVDLGMKPDDVFTFEVNLPESRYGDGEVRVRFHRELQRRLANIGNVRAVGAISVLPVTGRAYTWGARVTRNDSTAEEFRTPADQRIVAGDYFGTLGIAVLHGRSFGDQDNGVVTARIIINRTLAETAFGSPADAVGRSFNVGGIEREVVGVVADVPVTVRGEVAPLIYHPHSQYGLSRHWRLIQVINVRRGAGGILNDIAREVAALDPDLVVYRPRPLVEIVGGGRARERFAAQLIAAFALLAVLLSALGLYGVLSHSVRKRRREIGIRVALGARERTVLAMVVRHAMSLAGAGVVIGVLGALALTSWLSTLVFQIGVRDPATFALAAGAMTLVALVASGLPAWSAARTNPVEAFRAE
jgi:putative ABC transport system permease protein